MNSMIIIILIVSLAYYMNEVHSLCAPDYCEKPINCPLIPTVCEPPTAINIPGNSTDCRCCPTCIVYKSELIY